MATNDKTPLARLHALATLDGLQALRPEIVAEVLRDDHPGVLRHAIRLSEKYFEGRRKRKAFVEQLAELVKHQDPFVQLQLAYTLGETKQPLAGKDIG